MPRIGITGHVALAEACTELIARELRQLLARYEPSDLVGVTCLARGADQLFAHEVLDKGGRIEIVLPAEDYRVAHVKPSNIDEFDDLMSKADLVRTMPFAVSRPEAYLAASEEVLATVELLVAVWDGEPAAGKGGTADVVTIAREKNIPVIIIWPKGASRACK